MKQAVNKIIKGLFVDVDPGVQPEGTVIDTREGRFIFNANGDLRWQNIKGDVESYSFYESGKDNKIYNICAYKNDYIIAFVKKWDTVAVPGGGDPVTCYFYKIVKISPQFIVTTIYQSSTDFFGTEIKQAFVDLISENEEYLYFNDGVNQPKCINIASSGLSSLPIKYMSINFQFDHGYLKLNGYTSGSLKCGVYYYFFRLYNPTHRIYTPWSRHTNAVYVTKSLPYSTSSLPLNSDAYVSNLIMEDDEYQSNVGIKLETSKNFYSIESFFTKIQIVYLKLNGKNLPENAYIFYDGNVLNGTYTHALNRGNIIAIDDLMISDITVTKAQELISIKDQIVVGNIEERQEPGLNISLLSSITPPTVTLEKVFVRFDNYNYTDNNQYPDINENFIFEGPVVRLTNNQDNNQLKCSLVFKASNGNYLIPSEFYSYLSGYSDRYITVYKRSYAKDKNYNLIVLDDTEIYKIKGFGIGGYYDVGFRNFADPRFSHHMKTYLPERKYALGILPIDLYGKQMNPRYVANFTTTESDFLGYMFDINGSGTVQDHASLVYPKLNNLDITDLIDAYGKPLVNGFFFIRSEAISNILDEGIIFPVLEKNDYSLHDINITNTPLSNNRKGSYVYYSPEFFFDKEYETEKADKLVLKQRYFTGVYTEKGQSNHSRLCKYYKSNHSRIQEKTVTIDKEQFVDSNVVIGQHPEYEIPGGIFVNTHYYDTSPTLGAGAKCILITQEDYENNDLYESIKSLFPNDYESANVPFILRAKRLNNDINSIDTDSYSITLNKYVNTGVYVDLQKLYSEGKIVDLKDGSRYIFKEINIPGGGDAFLNVWDFNRIIYGGYDASLRAEIDILPVFSKINLHWRSGNTINKEGVFRTENSIKKGLGISGTYIKLEDYENNQSAISTNFGRFYIPLPYNFLSNYKYKNGIRWTTKRALGQEYRHRFLAANYNSLPTYDEIQKMIIVGDRLFTFGKQTIGSFPFNEIITANDGQGKIAKIGTGEDFIRYDIIQTSIGITNRNLFVEGKDYFYFFNNNILCRMQKNGQMAAEDFNFARTKGVSSIFVNNTPLRIIYDELRSFVYFVYQSGQEILSLEFSETDQIFTGIFSMPFTEMFTINGHNYVYDTNKIYSRETGSYNKEAYVKFVVGQENIGKIFTNMIVNASENFFNKVIYSNNYQSKEEIVMTNSNGQQVNMIPKYCKYFNRRWYIALPIDANNMRLRSDNYLFMKFVINSNNGNLVQLSDVITEYQEELR